jgi:para-nitrobenzyl esterase
MPSTTDVRRSSFLTWIVLAALLVAIEGCGSSGEGGAGGGSDTPGGECSLTLATGRIAGSPVGEGCAFHSIPYAAPPVGALRFRAPGPVSPWPGTLPAPKTARLCPQYPDPLETYPDSREIYTDEDCLYLDVWAPKIDSGARPVLVFIPGGAFLVGSASFSTYDAAALSSRGDVVVVSINYRLGILGWIELGAWDARYRGSGNNGLRDQMAALKWVQTNIERFGGDPKNVTVFGHSAGAASASALLAIDHPEQLFRRAILASGSGYQVHNADYQNVVASRIRAAAGSTGVDDLVSLPTEQVLALQQRVYDEAPLYSGDNYFGPYIDGDLLPAPVINRVDEGNAKDIDLLLGTTLNETKFWALYDPTLVDLAPAANLFFPPALAADRDAITSAYRAARPGSAEGDVTHAMLTDQIFRVPLLRLAEAQARHRATYVYEFRWHPSLSTGKVADVDLGAVHSLEVPFIFGNLDIDVFPGASEALAVDRPTLIDLSEQMMDAWLTFTRHGHPNPGPDGWSAYDSAERTTMVFGIPSTTERAPRESERMLWRKFGFETWSFTP